MKFHTFAKKSKRMKFRIIFLTLAVFLIGITSVHAQKATKAKKQGIIEFEQVHIDLGDFPREKGKQTVTFKFKNTGTGKLVINNVSTSCGCTVADYPKHFIKPGGTGEIKVSYDGTKKAAGKFQKSITVYTDGGKKFSRLHISGYMYDGNNPTQRHDEAD